jgi:DNA-binding response OmpR family regulator
VNGTPRLLLGLLNWKDPFLGKSVKKQRRLPLKGARILLVEDVALLALEIAQTLAAAGAKIVGPVGTVEEAVELAKSEEVSCAVLDVMLNGKEVYPAAQVLSERGAGLMFVTAVPDTRRIWTQWPRAKLVPKPYTDERLLEAAIAACTCNPGDL